MNAPYLSIEEGPSLSVEIRDDLSESFPATETGIRAAGAFICTNYGELEYQFSSSLDFPHDYGVGISTDDIHRLVAEGYDAQLELEYITERARHGTR